MRYLVDTDWVIDHLHGHAQVVSRLEDLETARLDLSIISLAEMYEGVLTRRQTGTPNLMLPLSFETHGCASWCRNNWGR